MISAGTFARQSSVWSEVAPTLDQVVRWANERRKSIGRAVPSGSPAERHALIAETAFALAKYDAESRSADIATAEQEARDFLSKLPRSEGTAEPLSSDELEEVAMLKQRTESYTHLLQGLRFKVPVPGCGVIDSTFADIEAEDELIEVKAVTRQFRGSDFRQLLTYVAMFYASGRKFNRVTLLNPRQAYFVSTSIDRISASSSGKSAVEFLQDLVGWMAGLQISA